MSIELKIIEMTVDGQPKTCPDCVSPTFSLDGRGIFDFFPAWGNCASGHSWEDPLITVGHLKSIKAASTGRQRAEDDDTFEIETGGVLLAGTLHPDVILDDLKRAGDVYWTRLIKPAARRRKNKVVRAITRPIKRAARNGVAATKAGALEAAWTAQAGGYETDPDYQPEPINPCPACNGKRYFSIDSRLHDKTKIRCSVCFGTGEID
ncbi:hypothetical protein ACIP6X_02375 [Streptomyces coeruleorubidus]|uniref:hypothetical protein n=1 Tax=Streptomyces coeruleorubidus TaxID=116188 RepID=UPI0037FD3156